MQAQQDTTKGHGIYRVLFVKKDVIFDVLFDYFRIYLYYVITGSQKEE